MGPFFGQDHMRVVSHYIKRTWPKLWDRHNGRDHIFWMTLDRWAAWGALRLAGGNEAKTKRQGFWLPADGFRLMAARRAWA